MRKHNLSGRNTLQPLRYSDVHLKHSKTKGFANIYWRAPKALTRELKSSIESLHQQPIILTSPRLTWSNTCFLSKTMFCWYQIPINIGKFHCCDQWVIQVHDLQSNFLLWSVCLIAKNFLLLTPWPFYFILYFLFFLSVF